MHKRIATIIITFLVSHCFAAAAAPLGLELRGERFCIKKTDRYQVDVQASKLVYTTESGGLDETGGTYLIQFTGRVPLIVDQIQGFDPHFEILESSPTGKRYLLCYYFAGASQYQLKIYGINDDEVAAERLTLLKPVLSSNAKSISVDKSIITVGNQTIQDDGSVRTTSDRYILKEAELVRIEK